jgi:hypothetical protein
MDSACVFLKDFGLSDFMAEGKVPYSIINEGREILQSTKLFGPNHARNNYLKDRAPVAMRMGRQEVIYDYVYAPFIWSKKVWQSLEENYNLAR